MKKLILISLLGCIILSAFRCHKDDANDVVYRGKLVRKGICSNYTIAVISGSIDTSKIEASWTDPQTATTFQNVFRLDSPCDFPSGIAEGGEFTFTISSITDRNCAICLAYYPTPQKGLAIKVLTTQ